MFPEEARGRQERLNNIIYELSKELWDENDKRISQTLAQMTKIYENDFRHNYSDFFPVILEIYKRGVIYDVDYLSNNLELLQSYVELKYSSGAQEYKELYSRFIKLFDHLGLQISQINYIIKTENKVNDAAVLVENALRRMDDAEARLEEKSDKLDKANDKLNESVKNLNAANQRADSIQTDLISILSIFAAIVLAVSGSISILGNAIQAALNTETTKLVLIILICGMVLFNAIFFLIYLISRITGKEMFIKCYKMNAECNLCTGKKCSFIGRIRKCMPCVFYYNLLMIVLIVIDGIVWKLL